MVRITIDEELTQKLLAAGGIADLCDPSGRVVGHVFAERGDPSLDWREVLPELTDDEIERRLNSNEPGLTTEQVKAKLRELS